MPFIAQQFDLIFSRFSLMYGKDLNSVIERIAQILKDKGEVYALTNVPFINKPNLFKKIKEKPVPLDLVIGDKKLRLLNYIRTLEEYKKAFVKANLTLEDEKYFNAIGLSVAPEYKYKNEINFERGVFKLLKI
jgi:SAM-dependent methyltransferase